VAKAELDDDQRKRLLAQREKWLAADPGCEEALDERGRDAAEEMIAMVKTARP